MSGSSLSDSLSNVDEPVRRYFEHALAAAPSAPRSVRLEMAGRIRIGAWIPYTAAWEGDGFSFRWDARAGWGAFKPLAATDRYAEGSGSMEISVLGRRVVRDHSEDATRSAAGRAAVEAAIWSPASLLPDRGVRWSAGSETQIVATLDVPPEQPEVRLEIDPRGAVRECSVMRWKGKADGYVACGCQVHAERAFDGIRIASLVTVGWWFGTPRWSPFFEAGVVRAELVADAG